MLRAVVLTQYRRVSDRRTDGQTDGIAVASTALAMRALRRAVKSEEVMDGESCELTEGKNTTGAGKCKSETETLE